MGMSPVNISTKTLRTFSSFLSDFLWDDYMGKNWIGRSSVGGLFIVFVRSSD